MNGRINLEFTKRCLMAFHTNVDGFVIPLDSL